MSCENINAYCACECELDLQGKQDVRCLSLRCRIQEIVHNEPDITDEGILTYLSSFVKGLEWADVRAWDFPHGRVRSVRLVGGNNYCVFHVHVPSDVVGFRHKMAEQVWRENGMPQGRDDEMWHLMEVRLQQNLDQWLEMYGT